jgi:predicted ArsR family transcriptional regulator
VPADAPISPVMFSSSSFSSAVTAITNAFGDGTRREIFLAAHEADSGLTASEVADRFAIHANVARHHLDKLVAGGYLEVSVEAPTGPGRPSKRYRRAADAMPIPDEVPIKTDDLVLQLLGKALARLPAHEAEALAEEVGVGYGRALADTVSAGTAHRSLKAALATVAEALTAHGFAAHTERRGTQLRIVNEHCPFGDTAIEHPVICAVDRGMVKGMLSALYGDSPEPELAASLPMGDTVCVTSF